VNIQICSSNQNCEVLQGSISTNFNSGAICVENSGSASGDPVFITCTGVTSISQTLNTVSGRIWFDSAVSTGGISIDSSQNFGTVTVSWSIPVNTLSPLSATLTTGYSSVGVITLATDVVSTTDLNGNGPLIAVPTG